MGTDTCVSFSFQFGYEFIFFLRQIEMQQNQVNLFTMITFFLGNMME